MRASQSAAKPFELNFQVSLLNAAPTALVVAGRLDYAPCGFGMRAVQQEIESADDGACALVLNGLRVCFRVAKNPAHQAVIPRHPTWHAADFAGLSAEPVGIWRG
jgi:hypothetical protein